MTHHRIAVNADLHLFCRLFGRNLGSYDTIGNLTSKGGYTYKYPAATTAHPHAVTCTNWSGTTCATGASYQYDANGNMESGGGRTYLWSAENQPLRVVKNGVAEDYLYNADNERVRVTTGGDHTFYFGAGGEETGTTKRHAYTFNGQVIAERDVPTSGASTFRYLHGDHLGSVVATSTSNTSPTVTKQYFMPWGEKRQGNLASTTDRDFTGQRKDGTGLLFYNARYYDPELSRFISPDTIVPGMASGKGGMGSIGVNGDNATTLTVDFHEGQFAAGVSAENAFTREKGFNFELSGEDAQDAKYQGGPPNPQALNRYSYVLNNPLRYTDPTGHWTLVIDIAVEDVEEFLAYYNIRLNDIERWTNIVAAGGAGAAALIKSLPRWAQAIVLALSLLSAAVLAHTLHAAEAFGEWIRKAAERAGPGGRVRVFWDAATEGYRIEPYNKNGKLVDVYPVEVDGRFNLVDGTAGVISFALRYGAAKSGSKLRENVPGQPRKRIN